jgi:hypothetical protein
MLNVRILGKNLAENCTVTESPALVSTSLGGANLGKPTLRAIAARTSGLSAQRLTIDFASSGPANMIAVTRHNQTTSGTIRAQIMSATGSPQTRLHDTTPLAAFSTSGLDTDIDDYLSADFDHLRHWRSYFTQVAGAASVVLDAADASNPDGYMEWTKLFCGKYHQFTYDPPYGGLELAQMDDSRGSRALDGSHLVDKRWKANKITIKHEFITDGELPSWLALIRYCGKDKEVWLDCYPDLENARGIYHRGAYRIVDSSAFNPHQIGLYRNTTTFEQT